MSAEIVPFQRPERTPSGFVARESRCAGCGHEWLAVAPTELKWLECPECHALKGGCLKFLVPDDSSKVFSCSICAGFLWTPYLHGDTPCMMCAECGHTANALDLFS